MLLAKNSRLNILREVLDRYNELHTSDNKEIKVNVKSVVRINGGLRKSIKKNFIKKWKNKS